MANIIKWLLPKEKKAFEMIAKQSENAVECAKELKSFVDKFLELERHERKSNYQTIKNIENKADELTKELIGRLNKISSHEKEDIKRIILLLDDMIDSMDSAAHRFVIFSIERKDPYITKMTNAVHEIVNELHKSLAELKNLKSIKEHSAKIHNLEKQVDGIYHEALTELFHFYKSPVDIMKIKEIYEFLEKTADKCKSVMNAIENLAPGRP